MRRLARLVSGGLLCWTFILPAESPAELWVCPQPGGGDIYTDRELPGCRNANDPTWKAAPSDMAPDARSEDAPAPPTPATTPHSTAQPAAASAKKTIKSATPMPPPPGSINRWASLSEQASKAHAKKNLPEAERLHAEALKVAETIGPDSRQRATTLYSLGTVLLDMDRPADAERQFQKSLTIYEELDGRQGTDVAKVMSAYAGLLRKTNKPEEAADLESRAKAMRSATR